jgi:predicted unusual protein kinase regulating ubiquinone biosynthesis (AarF/ABC1/UbiB family)
MKTIDNMPSSKLARASKMASTGMKIGGNYLKHFSKKTFVKDYDSNELNRDNAEDVYNCLSELKGSALKVAQMLSMDSNVMPEAYSDKFALAQYQAPPISSPLVRKLVKRQLGDYPENIFEEFTPNAVKAASIGQVHKAQYKGKEVAVKLQYPGVANSISSDLKLVKPFALKLLNMKKSEVKVYFKEIENKMIEETNYLTELEQGQFIAEKCAHIEGLGFANYLPELCSEKLLCMDWLEGDQIDSYFKDSIPQEIRDSIGQRIWDFYAHQVHELKFIHADPHPGNFLIGPEHQLNIIDFGCMKRLPEKFYNNYFAASDKTLFDREDDFRENLLQLEIIRSNDSEKTREFFSKSFKKLMRLAMAPFHSNEFDFSQSNFFVELYETGDKISKKQKQHGYSHSRGSKHFIYTNRTYYGIYNILHLLKARVKTGGPIVNFSTP